MSLHVDEEVSSYSTEFNDTKVTSEVYFELPSFEDSNVKAQLVIKSKKWVTLVLENKTDSILELNNNIITFTDNSTGKTKVIDASHDNIPSALISANGKFKKSYFSADSLSSSGFLLDWIPINEENLSKISVTFQYEKDYQKNL